MRVLLIDDHPLIRSAIETVISGLGEQVEVIGVGTAAEARAILARDGQFDLALIDLQLTDADGFVLLQEVRQQHPSVPAVVISGSDRTADVVRSIDEGAMGFIPKRTSNEVLVHALRIVMSGGIYVPPMALRSDLPAEPVPAVAVRAAAAPPGPLPADDIQHVSAVLNLTPRQGDVLRLLLRGLPNKMIARELGLSVETVKDHVASLLRSLGVNSRTQAVLAVGQLLQR